MLSDDPGQGPFVGGLCELVDESRRGVVADSRTRRAVAIPGPIMRLRLASAPVAQEDDRLAASIQTLVSSAVRVVG